ncbi:hypothetical protein CTEN210_18158 [Chaetoceros tenuissimus]|uniref:Leucine-rich repeat domain-containing protein n=1 Tax=Chaetoceros tenuissimus TaxID=426638 RepID=A0AAD3HF68_9STRA|nr:hypothetical protein CTEN210_18158 [Chaetoceros tenuissimus]
MYKGKKTLFYNGEIFWERGFQIYDEDERNSWEVIIVLPGVEVIPEYTFSDCRNVKTVIMADTVKRVERNVFYRNYSLEFVKLSTNLEYIGRSAFRYCDSLLSIFIPPSCTEIDDGAFQNCEKLIIFHVPQHTELRYCLIDNTALIKTSPLQNLEADTTEFNNCVKNINRNDECELHRACASFNPLEYILLGILKCQGLAAFRKPNAIGITPLEYLEANPYADIDQHKLMKRYIAEMMGENVL